MTITRIRRLAPAASRELRDSARRTMEPTASHELRDSARRTMEPAASHELRDSARRKLAPATVRCRASDAASAVKPVVKCTLIFIALLGLWGARSPVSALERVVHESSVAPLLNGGPHSFRPWQASSKWPEGTGICIRGRQWGISLTAKMYRAPRARGDGGGGGRDLP